MVSRSFESCTLSGAVWLNENSEYFVTSDDKRRSSSAQQSKSNRGIHEPNSNLTCFPLLLICQYAVTETGTKYV